MVKVAVTDVKINREVEDREKHPMWMVSGDRCRNINGKRYSH